MEYISSSIEIEAAPRRVWSIVTDFASYAKWNPFIQSISGPLEPGHKLKVQIKPPGGRAMSFSPTVLVVESNKKICWRGRLLVPGIFDGVHHFEIKQTATGSLFSQGEKFTGLLVRLMGETSLRRTQRGFVEMNEALKRRAEA